MRDIFASEAGVLRRKLKRSRIAFTILLVLFGAFVYMNYDYLLFKFIISENYIYEEALAAVYGEALGAGNYGYLKNFDEAVISIVTEKIRTTADDKYTFLYNPKEYKNSKTQKEAEAQNSRLRVLSSSTVYISLPNISKQVYEFIFANSEKIKSHKNIIIDLRDNYGGDLKYLYKIESMFLDKGDTLGYEKSRFPIFSREVKAGAGKVFEFEQIVFLQNKNTASAAEAFILALKENLPNVGSVGETSFGKGMAQLTVPLTSGYALRASVLRLLTPLANSVDKTGTVPDIKLADENIARDDVIEYVYSEYLKDPDATRREEYQN
jgi:C-terminal processing protease CtpA/Prc